MTRAQLEKKYGIHIVENGYYNPKYICLYDMYSADGCRWEAGLRTIKQVEQECRLFEKHLLHIKQQAEGRA